MRLSTHVLLFTVIMGAVARTGHCISPMSRTITADSLPAAWAGSQKGAPDLPVDCEWWKEFGDPVLDSLLVIGERNNYDVLTAMRRMSVARLSLNEARSLYYPQLSLNAGWTKSRSAGAISGRNVPSQDVSYFSADIDMSWQIDVFGKITAKARQQKHAYMASRAEYAATMLALRGNIADAYISLRLLQAQQEIANRHIASQKSVFDIAQARYNAGLASKLDVAQAGIVYNSTLATIPQLDAAIMAAKNSLIVLLGEIPGTTDAALDTPRALPDCHRLIATGVPMDLLRRRPDVAEAEQNLAAAADAVGIARKDYLPTLTLNGSIGTRARNIDGLFGKNSLAYTIAPTLSWTIFDGFSRKYQVAAAREQMEIQIDNYNLTVATAVADVSNALAAYSSALREIDSYATVVDESRQAVELSVDLYRGGLTSFNNVAQAQTDYLTYTNSWLQARGKALTSLVKLYEALGGGWTADELLNGI